MLAYPVLLVGDSDCGAIIHVDAQTISQRIMFRRRDAGSPLVGAMFALRDRDSIPFPILLVESEARGRVYLVASHCGCNRLDPELMCGAIAASKLGAVDLRDLLDGVPW